MRKKDQITALNKQIEELEDKLEKPLPYKLRSNVEEVCALQNERNQLKEAYDHLRHIVDWGFSSLGGRDNMPGWVTQLAVSISHHQDKFSHIEVRN